MQTFMGGYLVNYFNRFGRQWQTYVEAEGASRTNIENINQFYVRSANGSQVPLSSLVKVSQTTGPEFIYRFNEYNAAQLNITGAPGYSSGQVRRRSKKSSTRPCRRARVSTTPVCRTRNNKRKRAFLRGPCSVCR